GIRRAFQAPSGKKLIVSDFEQLEMRIMADRSQDAKMIQAIRNGKDLHSFTAGEMEDGISYEEVAAAKKADEPNDRQKWLKGLRQSMKAVGFGIIYGAGPSKIAENITINEEDAWRAVEEMDAEELGNQIARKMRDNPLLSVDQAQRLVGDAAIARGKIEAYFRVFPRVKSFMDGTPGNCKFRMQNDLLGNQQFRPDNSDPETSYNWDIVQDREGAQLLTRTGHSKPFGFVQTYLGRYRRLEDIDHRQYAYRGHAEREAVNCFDAETEALTQRGWVKGFELLPNDMFLTKNADTGELKWNLAVRRWFYPDYRGPMVRLGNGRSFETLTTPEHRWLVTDKKTKTTREMKSEQFLQLSSKQSDYAIHMAGSYSQKWSAYTDDFATLVGWTLTDGCYGETYLNIAQTKEHRRLEIEALLNRMGLRWNSYDPGEGRSVQYKVSGNVVSLIKGILPDKTLTPEFVLSLGDSARQALYTSMMAGDGFEHPSKTHLFVAGSEVRADMFQFLCILLGRSTSKKFREYQAPKQNGSKGCWEVRILRRATAQTSCRELIEDYEGGVWCVTVPNSFAVFRRAGRVFVSGNTVIQGTAADLIKGAMLRIESNEELNMMGAQLLNQIHDELVIEIPEEYAEAAMPIIEECMMHPFVPGEDPLCVPIPTDGKICNDWAEGK
ncbi:MAG: hypothetical protein HKO76_05515, partial [Acidimicrobiia bacterium]|nr:hypothetical protein [Acidimicrobiia bacterium]